MEGSMSVNTFFVFFLALVFVLLAVAMSMAGVSEIEKSGYWLLAAAFTGLAIFLYGEDTRPCCCPA
jgi:hypothetical protein